jgi:L-rhamnose mutarotase
MFNWLFFLRQKYNFKTFKRRRLLTFARLTAYFSFTIMTMQRFCLALDLKPDPLLIAAYDQYHQAVWPEILASIRDAGIERLEIYRLNNRLFMVLEANDSFSWEQKAAADASNPRVQEWETLMWQYQQAIPGAKPGEKWMLMERIFYLV